MENKIVDKNIDLEEFIYHVSQRLNSEFASYESGNEGKFGSEDSIKAFEQLKQKVIDFFDLHTPELRFNSLPRVTLRPITVIDEKVLSWSTSLCWEYFGGSTVICIYNEQPSISAVRTWSTREVESFSDHLHHTAKL